MADATYWWLAAGLLVVAELLTGTFYLLMLACGLAVAALVAHLGAAPAWQWASAALAGGACVLVWRQYRLRWLAPSAEAQHGGGDLDLGQSVEVTVWRADGTCSVKYRGSQWEATLAPGVNPEPGVFVISDVQGSRLVLTRRPPP